MVLAAALAGGGGGPGAQTSATPTSAGAIGQLVDRTFDLEGVDCKRLSGRPGRQASSRRFTCQLPGLDGTIRIAVDADGQSFTLIGGAVRRTVSTESPAELHAAGLLDARGSVSHAVCALRAARHFVCGARFNEPGYRADVEVDLEVTKTDRYFTGACRVTALGPRPRSIYACNNLTWSINMEESTLAYFEEERAR